MEWPAKNPNDPKRIFHYAEMYVSACLGLDGYFCTEASALAAVLFRTAQK
jgi:hypothetical protein